MAKGDDYGNVIEKVFLDRYTEGDTEVEFQSKDLHDAASTLGIKINNIPDTLYSYRFRKKLPSCKRSKILLFARPVFRASSVARFQRNS